MLQSFNALFPPWFRALEMKAKILGKSLPLFRHAERKCNVVESLGPSGICNGACVLFRHFMCSSVDGWLLDLSLVYQGKRVYNYPFLHTYIHTYFIPEAYYIYKYKLRPGLNVAFYIRRIELPNKVHVKCDV